MTRVLGEEKVERCYDQPKFYTFDDKDEVSKAISLARYPVQSNVKD